ncbi:MAG: SDR family NAD(P)-dependent oxidoreductase [bacterium]|nr:SDR family NAD(P)-dependent oxidoreductase [bacterium]
MSPVREEDLKTLPSGPYLILDDCSEAGLFVQRSLKAEGLVAKLLIVESGHEVPSVDQDITRFSSIEQLDGILENSNYQTVIHLAGSGLTDGLLSQSSERLAELLDTHIFSAFRVAQSLIKSTASNKNFFQVTARGGHFGLEKHEKVWEAQSGLGGFLRCFAKEHPEIHCRILDFEPYSEDVSAEDRAGQLLLELQQNHGFEEVGYKLDERWTQVPVLEHPNQPLQQDSVTDLQLKPNDVVVVTGGARGITATMVRDLGSKLPLKFVLLGRSPLEVPELKDFDFAPGLTTNELKTKIFAALKASGAKVTPREVERLANKKAAVDEIQEQIKALTNCGCQAKYYSVDVQDVASLKTVFSEVTNELGPIRGLIHGAGVLRDKFVSDKTLDQFQQVLSTKVLGLARLFESLDHDQLRLVIMFSSVAGKFGNVGQSDYAVANEILSQFCLQNPLSNCRFLAIDWGALAGGMVTPELARKFEAEGVVLIPPSVGADFFTHEILHGSPQTREIILGGKHGLELSQGESGTVRTPLRVSLSLNPKEEPVLRDHVLKDPVLPMAMVLEFLAQAASDMFPNLNLTSINDLKVHHGLSFPDGPGELHMECEDISLSDVEGRTVSIKAYEISKGKKILSYEADVILGLSYVTPQDPPSGLDKDRLKISLDDAYDRYLFHGPSLQCIRSIEGISDSGLVATIKTSVPKDLVVDSPYSDWITDPRVLDGMAQLGLIWLGETQGCIGIPQGLKEYVQLQPFDGSEVRCYLKIDKLNKASFSTSVDFWFTNDDDDILAYGRGWKAIFNESFNAFTTASKREGKA